MTDFTTTARGDRVAYDRYGSGPGLVFVAGAGPSRAVDPSPPRPPNGSRTSGSPPWCSIAWAAVRAPPTACSTWTASWRPSRR